MATNPPHDPEAVMAKIVPRWPAKAWQRPLFRVREWMHYFESSETRKYGKLGWLRVPNKHDGKGWARLTLKPAPMELFAAFVLICELASKAPARGYLCDEDGPWTAQDMQEMTRMPDAAPFERALAELATERIDWLEALTPNFLTAVTGRLPEMTGGHPALTGGSPGKTPSTGSEPETPGASPNFESAPGESSGHEPSTGRHPEEAGESPQLPCDHPSRSGKVRNVPPIAPQGGQAIETGSHPETQPAALAEKKEGGPGSMEAYHETVRRICALFDRASGVLSARGQNGLREILSALPLSEMHWAALTRMREARKKTKGAPEDLRLRLRELESADALAENLLGTAERAVEWLREQVGASAGTPEKNTGGVPAGWQQAAQELGIEAADWETLLPQGKAAIRRHLAAKKEGGAGA